jgi:hypothetical protein
MRKLWPPNRDWLTMIISASVASILLQLIFLLIARFGFQKAALWLFLPGLYPIIWATRGWFSSLTLLGNVVLFGTNFLFYYGIVWAFLGITRLVRERRSKQFS